MKKMLLCSLILLSLACGKKTDPTTKEAEKLNKSSVDDVAADSSLGKFDCDGEGDSFTGKYDFKITSLKGKCSDPKSEIDLGDDEFTLNCTQKNKDFICKAETDVSLTGCITKDGKFKMEAEVDLSKTLKESGIDIKDFEGAAKAFMVGTINAAGGVAQYSLTAKQGKDKNACIFKGKLEVQQSN